MDNWWERFAGWVVAALFAVTSTFLGYCRKQWIEEMKGLNTQSVKLEHNVHKHSAMLGEHQTHLKVTDVHIEAMKDDLGEIKTSIRNVHSRIDENNKSLNDKLDRLLER
ncbi:hypothetical protein LCGC14_2075820 [marine sediment metagenome]|uniref:Uncharacterized protein n=1 Tax=marine sediment metagenome TaxID=412755 RepID=A0A0F9GVE7_9ZZZZ